MYPRPRCQQWRASLEEGTFFYCAPRALGAEPPAVGLAWFHLFLGRSCTPATSGSSRGFLATRRRYHVSKAWKQGGTRKGMYLGSLQGLTGPVRLTSEPCAVYLNQRPYPLPSQPGHPISTQTYRLWIDWTCGPGSCAQGPANDPGPAGTSMDSQCQQQPGLRLSDTGLGLWPPVKGSNNHCAL